MKKDLHIVCFDNPFPPTYGGAIDVFYRIKALAQADIHITLHCFYKGELQRSDELEQLCQAVYYYPRKQSILQHCTLTPYSVASRTNDNLLPRLLVNNAPILFEGLVSCALMEHPSLRNRKKIFRECNVEHDYYHALGRASTSLWKKLFYHIEAWRLQRFEHCLNYATEIWALAHQDEAYFKHTYPKVKTVYVPCAHGRTQIKALTGMGKPYILYHGNLAVEENEKAATHIIEHIAPFTHLPILIAGHAPSSGLIRLASTRANVQIIADPTTEHLDTLIQEAQVHLLITFQATGIKLKLLNVLYNGRHIVVNPTMITGTDYASLCHIGNNDASIIALCNQYSKDPFSKEEIEARRNILLNDNQSLELYNRL